MKKLQLNYDKTRDVLYVLKGSTNTLNLPYSPCEDIRIDHETYEVSGYIITNFSEIYPKLVDRFNSKDKWFVEDFFESRLADWNSLLAPLRTRKARLDFLMKERECHHRPTVHH